MIDLTTSGLIILFGTIICFINILGFGLIVIQTWLFRKDILDYVAYFRGLMNKKDIT